MVLTRLLFVLALAAYINGFGPIYQRHRADYPEWHIPKVLTDGRQKCELVDMNVINLRNCDLVLPGIQQLEASPRKNLIVRCFGVYDILFELCKYGTSLDSYNNSYPSESICSEAAATIRLIHHRNSVLNEWANYFKELFSENRQCQDLCDDPEGVSSLCLMILAGHKVLMSIQMKDTTSSVSALPEHVTASTSAVPSSTADSEPELPQPSHGVTIPDKKQTTSWNIYTPEKENILDVYDLPSLSSSSRNASGQIIRVDDCQTANGCNRTAPATSNATFSEDPLKNGSPHGPLGGADEPLIRLASTISINVWYVMFLVASAVILAVFVTCYCIKTRSDVYGNTDYYVAGQRRSSSAIVLCSVGESREDVKSE